MSVSLYLVYASYDLIETVLPVLSVKPHSKRSRHFHTWAMLADQAIPGTISEGRAEFRKINKTLLWDEFSHR